MIFSIETYIIDPQTFKFLFVNKNASENALYSSEEYKDMRFTDITNDLSENDFKGLLEPIIKNIKSFVSSKLSLIRKDGSVYDVITKIESMQNSESTSILINAQKLEDKDSSGHIDFNKYLELERSLIESEEKYKTAFYTSPDSVTISRINGEYADVNDGFIRLTGYSREDVIGKIATEIKIWNIPEDREKLTQALKKYGHIENLRSDFRCKDGSIKTALLSAKIVKFHGKDMILSITKDITDYVKLQEQLSHSLKLEAIGKLAGGIAHDFNNLLSVIFAYCELILSGMEKDDPNYEKVEQILETAIKASRLTKQLLTFSRKQPFEPKIIDVNKSIKNIYKMLKRLISENIEIKTDLKEGIDNIKVDPGQFDQILINLAVNARDAMQNGGTLTIETSEVFLDANYIKKHNEIALGKYILIAISDSGIGIDKDIISKIFDPFFTTKELGRGTGMGLSTVYGIVKQSGGTIDCYSEKGCGTSFKIYLPSVIKIESDDNTKEHSIITGNAEILIVEDDISIKKVLEDSLKSFGYKVIVSKDENDALYLVSQNKINPDIVICDVIMEHMNGKELVSKIKEILPNIKVLFMSGYTNNIISNNHILDKDTNFIQKPFSLNILSEKIHNILKT